MVTSTLCRKVFDQVNLLEDLINAFWIERRLQLMQINGLVKMVQGSKKMDIDYIDGFLPRYQWSYRPSPLDIAGCFDVYCLLQQFNQDFSWGHWEELTNIKNVQLFQECVMFSAQNFKPPAYALAMYKGKYEELQMRTKLVDDALAKPAGLIHNPISNDDKNKLDAEWEQLKNFMKRTSMVGI